MSNSNHPKKSRTDSEKLHYHQHQELEATFQSMSGAVFIFFVDGRPMRANKGAREILGFNPDGMPRDEIFNKVVFHDMDGNLVPVEALPSSRALSGEDVTGEHLQVTNIHGEMLHIIVSASPIFFEGQLIGASAVWQNISRYERLVSFNQSQREAAEESFHQLADAMPQLVWTARPDGTVDYYNQRYREYSGIDTVDGSSWEWGPVLHEDDRQPTVEAWQKSVLTGEVYQCEHRVLVADGSYRWHLSRGVPARDENGNIIKWYGTATDIHDQKTAEEKLKRSNQELEAFAFVASHDLNEPLRKIRAFGDRLEQSLGSQLDPRASDLLHRMLAATGRMQAMIDGLLQLSRVSTQGQAFSDIDLNEIAREVVSDLESSIDRTGGKVIVHTLPSLQADPVQMRRLLQNLISNAIKFHLPDVPPVVEISAEVKFCKEQGSTCVCLSIRDNGIGFDTAFLDRMFQPFQRLHGRSEYEGTGMGLAICKRIVERHGGDISADSVIGQGSTFTVKLPQRQASDHVV